MKYFWLRDSQHVILEGIHAKDSGIGIRIGRDNPKECTERTTNVEVRNCRSDRHGWWGVGISGCPEYPTEDIVLDGVKVFDTAQAEGNGHNIKLSSWVPTKHSRRVLIKNCEIARAWYHGVQSSNGWDDVTVKGCKIYDNGTKSPGAMGGIRFGTTVNGTAEYNELWGKQRSFYLQSNPTNINIRKNYIHDSVIGVYLHSVNGGVYINDNWMQNNKKDLQYRKDKMSEGIHFVYRDKPEVTERPPELDGDPTLPPPEPPEPDPDPVDPPSLPNQSISYKVRFEGTMTIEGEV